MTYYNYFPPAKTCAATFINIMHVNDTLGIVSFNDNASIVYPAGGSAAAKMTSVGMIYQAAQSIMTLQSSGNTNMVAALSTARSLLASSPTPKGMVLLSDGEWNVGGDPLPGLPTDIPVYTIGLGANGQAQTLTSIAAKTGGTYNFAPDPTQLQKMYDAIANKAQVAALVTDEATAVPQFGSHTTAGTVAAGAPAADFIVSWGDWGVAYTPSTPVGAQVNVYLYDPNGQKVTTTPRAVGPGYVVIEVQDPQPGLYSLSAWYSGTGQLNYTGGIFDHNVSVAADLTIHTDEPSVGDPLEFSVHVTDEGDHVEDSSVLAHVEAPMVSVAEALAAHGPALEAWPEAEEGPATPEAKLAALESQVGSQKLLPRGRYPVQMEKTAPGVFTGKLPAAIKAGAHTVHAEIRGHAPAAGSRFQRSVQASVLVPETGGARS